MKIQSRVYGSPKTATTATEPAAQTASGSARSSRRCATASAAGTAPVAYPSGVAIRPAATVSFVASSIRMNEPVSRLRV